MGVRVFPEPPVLPDQSGNTGKFLSTDGTDTLWAAVVTDSTPTTFLLMGA